MRVVGSGTLQVILCWASCRLSSSNQRPSAAVSRGSWLKGVGPVGSPFQCQGQLGHLKSEYARLAHLRLADGPNCLASCFAVGAQKLAPTRYCFPAIHLALACSHDCVGNRTMPETLLNRDYAFRNQPSKVLSPCGELLSSLASLRR